MLNRIIFVMVPVKEREGRGERKKKKMMYEESEIIMKKKVEYRKT